MKSLQKQQNSTTTTYYYDPQSAGINVQTPQSESTPKRLTLSGRGKLGKVVVKHGIDVNIYVEELIFHQKWLNKISIVSFKSLFDTKSCLSNF